ncbi:MAG: hypothetical protein ACUVUT_07030 [Candidatus Bipolaricaulia bacterium]
MALLLLSSLALGLYAYGQVQVEVEAEFGLAGRYLPDWPVPVWVTIAAEGRSPLQGRIIVSQEVRSPWRGVVEERLILPFALPGKGRKRFELEFLVRGYIYPLQLAVVVDPTGETIFRREISLKERAAGEPLTLALVGRGEPFPMELPTGERPIRLEPEGFPSSWAGLLGARRLYLGRLYPEGLSPAQWAALIRWIEWGGELIVLGGENWYLLDSPSLRGLIPFSPTVVGEAAGRKVVLGEPHGEVLSRQGEIMLVAGPRGRGRVLFATVNLLATNPGEGGLWESLGRELRQRAGEEERPRLGAELLEQTALPFPSKPVLIGLYALFVVGLALSSWLAARRERVRLLPLLWVAGIAALIGWYLDRPEFVRPILGLELGLSHDLGETTLHSSWLALFAKAGRRLELRVVRQGEDEGYLRQALPEERGEHLYDVNYLPGRGGVGMSASFGLVDWQERSFLLERFSSELAKFQVTDGKVRAENKSPYPLRDCRLLSDEGRLYELKPGPGELGPGEAVEWGLGPEIEPPKEGPVARIYKLAWTELLGQRGLLCAWAAPGEFSQTSLEARTILRLALIEEDR